jgi:hypothetical protein
LCLAGYLIVFVLLALGVALPVLVIVLATTTTPATAAPVASGMSTGPKTHRYFLTAGEKVASTSLFDVGHLSIRIIPEAIGRRDPPSS